jgi:hypothetical protein
VKIGVRARLGPELGCGGRSATGLARAGEVREGGMEVGCCYGPKGGRGEIQPKWLFPFSNSFFLFPSSSMHMFKLFLNSNLNA